MSDAASDIIARLLEGRGLSDERVKKAFLQPDYSKAYDPFLLPDMGPSVERLVAARDNGEHISIYGDYDIDGLTATTVLLDSFEQFGFKQVDAFIPNRFVEGYGLTIDAIERIAQSGATLIVTVDCGSLSHKEVDRANELGLDVIVTDHHSVGDTMPNAIGTVNPKRTDHSYPFIDLPGVGVAFKLVQALQTRLKGIPQGQEKWLLDLVALGTVCDVVTLLDENRTHVYWGLQVLQKTRRPGLKALLATAKVSPADITARTLGYVLGPRMNAAGRLETANYSLDLLRAKSLEEGLSIAERLEQMNHDHRAEQNRIFDAACTQADELFADPVLVVSDPSWSHGIVGIVAAKLLERYQKPAFVLQEMGTQAKGSARSFGDFSAVSAIRASDEFIIKGGGHKLAAGVTMNKDQIGAFRKSVNDFYKQQKFDNQLVKLLPTAELTLEDFSAVDSSLVESLALLEPYGHGNSEPIFGWKGLLVMAIRTMGDRKQHVKLELSDKVGRKMWVLAFNAPDHFFAQSGALIDIWAQLALNEWQGRKSVEGRLLHLETNS